MAKVTIKQNILYVLFWAPFFLSAQNILPKSSRSNEKKRIVSFSADQLNYKKEDGEGINTLDGNVVFKKKDLTIYADKAIYQEQKQIEAHGNIRIFHSDGTQLYTQILYYDVDKEIAKFKDGVKLIKKNNIVTSDQGEYNDGDEIAFFRDNVKVVSDDQTMICNTLIYENLTQDYIQKHKDLFFDVNLNQDNPQKIYVSSGNVNIFVPKENIIIKGNTSIFYDEDYRSKIFGYPIMQKKIKNDFFYLYGKEMYVFKDENLEEKQQKTKKESDKKLIIKDDAKVYNKDIQAKAKSISYFPSKSEINFDENPFFWNAENQITAKYAHLKLNEDQIEKMSLKQNVMFINQTPLKNYNQISGNNMFINFKNNKVSNMLILGDANSIQYIDNEDKKSSLVTAINKVKCDKIKIKIKKNKIKKAFFLGIKEQKNLVGGGIYDPKKVDISETKLQGFDWRPYDRPTEYEVVYFFDKRDELIY